MSARPITAMRAASHGRGFSALDAIVAATWRLCALLMLVSGCDDGIASAATVVVRVHNGTSHTLVLGHELFIEGHTLDWISYGAWNGEPTTKPCEGSGFAVPIATMDIALAPNERGIVRWDPVVVQRDWSNSGPPANEDWCDRVAPVPNGSYDVAICPESVLILRDDGVYCPTFYECQTVRVRVSHVARQYDVTFMDDDVSACDG